MLVYQRVPGESKTLSLRKYCLVKSPVLFFEGSSGGLHKDPQARWMVFNGTSEHKMDDWGYPSFWVNYNDLTVTSLEIMVSIGNDPHMALIQVSEIL